MASRVLPALGLCLCLAAAHGHMLMTWPPQRGCLWGNKFEPKPRVVDPEAPPDFQPHFPAGDPNTKPGAGMRSQIREAGPAGWTPFEPEKAGFRWRSGVCGDLKTKPEHMRGGKYYNNGEVSVTYEEDGILSLDITVVAHHNGFLELRLCDISKTGGEISEAAFKQGHCLKLKRVSDPSCESGNDKMCAPINPDPRYEHRWDFPCRSSPSGRSYYGKGKAKFHLPAGWSGDHFVLHMYHTAANDCMPLGVTDFFEGPKGPNWGNCKGQGGAVGGYRRFPALCGGSRFPEEYYKCADIAITPRAGGSRPPARAPVVAPTPVAAPTPVVAPAPIVAPAPRVPRTPVVAPEPVLPKPTDAPDVSPEPARPPVPVGPLSELVLVADGERLMSFGNGDDVVIDLTGYRQSTFEMVTDGVVPSVSFFIDGKRVWVERARRYFLGGNVGPKVKYWPVPLNRKFTLKVSTGRNVMTATVTLNSN